LVEPEFDPVHEEAEYLSASVGLGLAQLFA
jgi:hypothetical protein